jgi:phosphoglycolate/pyridoxal phosphate phosphatase family enzyme
VSVNLSDKRFILLDCDGVIWRGNQVIEGAINTLNRLEEKGYKLAFVTNNSSLSRQGFKEKFYSLGFNPKNYIIINSAYGAASYLRDKKLIRVFIIGEVGLKEELELQGLYTTSIYEPRLQAVCIGWDRQLTWAKLSDAMWVILNDNGYFLGTNPDNSYPLAGGRVVPGAGAGIAALATACGKNPDIIIGKPNRFLLDLALKELGCFDIKEAVYIGDRLSTDILAGINAGMDTILVKTGISDDYLKKKIKPSLELRSITDVNSMLD